MFSIFNNLFGSNNSEDDESNNSLTLDYSLTSSDNSNLAFNALKKKREYMEDYSYYKTDTQQLAYIYYEEIINFKLKKQIKFKADYKKSIDNDKYCIEKVVDILPHDQGKIKIKVLLDKKEKCLTAFNFRVNNQIDKLEDNIMVECGNNIINLTVVRNTKDEKFKIINIRYTEN